MFSDTPSVNMRSTYDMMWREAMMELLDQLEAENPENPALAPKVSAWQQLARMHLLRPF